MSLILAVEPDPRQATRLSAVLRGRRDTRVVIAESATAAIEAIDGHIPDVLLTSQLLAPQDEQRLADWLRELGPAATHVHALTIPIFAGPVKHEPQRGLLSSFRRQKPAPQGCEPRLFAEHVASYLARGAASREDDAPRELAANPVESTEIPFAPTPVPEPAVTSWEPLTIIDDEGIDFTDMDYADPSELTDTHPEMSDVTPADPPTAVAATSELPVEDEGLWLLTRSPQVIEFDRGRAAASADAAPTAEPDTLPLGALAPLPTPQILTLPSEVVPAMPLEVVFDRPEVITVRDETWNRRVLPSREMELHAASRDREPSGEPDTTPPVQDEWGFFDPAKCGFSALLAKLDEITEDERQGARDAEASVRLVTHY
jgi:CheY-like chemotaxis protein